MRVRVRVGLKSPKKFLNCGVHPGVPNADAASEGTASLDDRLDIDDGVPSIASSGPTASSRPSIPSTVTSCNPSGLGRSDERVAKTPVNGRDSSSRGCT